MKINFILHKNSLQKIYLQIYEGFKHSIESAEVKADEKLPSVRQIAIKFNINVLTVLKAYDLLEKNNYIYKLPGKGCFVKEKSILMSHTQKPIINNFAILSQNINFASATPSSSTHPTKIFQSLMKEVLEEKEMSIFNYVNSQGLPELRGAIVEQLKQQNIVVDPNNIQVTSGSQQGLDLIRKLIMKRKSTTMIVGNPTYYGAIYTFSELAKTISIPLQTDGMDLEELEKILQKNKVDFLYSMINFESPTGICWSLAKKKQLLSLASKYNFLIIEDDCLSSLYYYGQVVTPLKALDTEEKVIYLHSYSKTIMPGLRLGYMILPSSMVSEVVAAKFSTDISTSGLLQFALYLFLTRGYLEKHLEVLKEEFQKKLELVLKELNEIEELSTPMIPRGGFYLWIQLPAKINSNLLYNILQEKGLSLLPGSVFFLHEEPENHFIRISFAAASETEIIEGFSILRTTLQELHSKQGVQFLGNFITIPNV